MVLDGEMEAKLEQWKTARAERDFARADALRAELRAAGYDPNPGPASAAKSRQEKLDNWKAAKADKDFTTADRIRAELRAEGFDPDVPGKSSATQSKNSYVEEKINQWKAAKAAKQYAVSDAIRAELRAMGVEPDPLDGAMPILTPTAVPPRIAVGPPIGSWTPPVVAYTPPVLAWTPPKTSWTPVAAVVEKPYDPIVEAELDRWVEARSEKDWVTSDAIRESLRARGVEPANERSGSAPSTEEELAMWQRAKKGKDYSRSDRIRDSLRSKGVDPEKSTTTSIVRYVEGPVGSAGFGSAGFTGVGGAASSTDAELLQWFDARERKDWAIADSVRERLRAKGIEPSQCQRPVAPWVSSTQMPGGYGKQPPAIMMPRPTPYAVRGDTLDAETERKLDQWKALRQNKDYAAADALRSQLRLRGIEPDKYR